MTVTPAIIFDQVEIGIEPSAANHADWLQFEDPTFRLLQKVVAVDDPNPNNEGRTVHEVRAVELVMPDNWDEAPTWRYGIKTIGLYGRPSTSPIRWFDGDKLCKLEHQHLIGEIEF
jgi:hypothetical protein